MYFTHRARLAVEGASGSSVHEAKRACWARGAPQAVGGTRISQNLLSNYTRAVCIDTHGDDSRCALDVALEAQPHALWSRYRGELEGVD